MSVDADALRIAMRGWASGVTIVMARHEGELHGMTASSFTSVSLDPPLILICVEKRTRTHRLIQASGAFAVTVLPVDRDEWADRFGGRPTDHADRLQDVDTFSVVTGAPILADYLSYFDCFVADAHPAGSHTIFVGNVVAAKLAEGRQPLVYWHRGYYRLAS
jgi:flavin reductase (DIM6/NTAB) family NADH-FMN oxidoreductase RutF